MSPRPAIDPAMAPAGAVDLDLLDRTWANKPGLSGWLTAVNHKAVGRRFVVTAMAFFAIGGFQSLLMRAQLGTPENTFLSAQAYNEMFTMHGTTMLFLFAVPVTEGLAIYLAPLMIGARDMPFPRLNAFGYFAYLFGGIFLYTSFLVGAAPDGGWFAYPPLTGRDYSPGLNMDFWLLGVTFVEISGIVAAIEIVVLILKFRAPGMSLVRMPLFVWASLVTSGMVLLAFPPLVIGSIMLELDRKIGTFFYNPAGGGDPLLWQHIFWWFGHPEVYIMSIPTFGVVSMIIPTFARTRIIGYTWIVVATVAIAVIGFGVWVHHMFATGLPVLGLTLFAAGSLVIAIPSGVQIVAWVGTLWAGHIRWQAPLRWIMGFFVIFVAGGITGVMFATLAFDWQTHDTYFVVAHFHYVILGGTLFPILAAITYWLPKAQGRLMSERLGRISFWMVFAGVNLTFFPHHILGLEGMARRIWTWPEGLGWEPWNMLSSLGAYLTAAGLLVFLADAVLAIRRGPPAGEDPWEAGTLEWATTSPPAPYNFATIPLVTGRDPLWDDPTATTRPDHMEWRRPQIDPAAPRREMVVTSVLDGDPEHRVTLPVASWWPLLLALALAVALVGVLINSVPLGVLGLIGVVTSCIGWLWSPEDDAAGLVSSG
ncbi:hypothetical protein BH23ACT9_BH23ACT9_30970 [soil metagenome]